MLGDIWKTIEEFSLYDISNTGKVRWKKNLDIIS